MRTDNLPQAIAAASRIPFSPVLRLGITPRREAGSVAPGLSAPLAAQAAGGSSSCAGHGAHTHSPATGRVCGQKSDRGVSPDDHSETGANSEQRAAERIDLIWSCAGIVLVLACVLFDAPFWIGQLLIAWGLA